MGSPNLVTAEVKVGLGVAVPIPQSTDHPKCNNLMLGVCLLMLTATALVADPSDADIVPHRNLSYVVGQLPAQTLDLYCPKQSHDVPLVIWIHGGAFKFGSKEGSPTEPVPLYLLLEGYAVASINYRLSGEAKFPAQLNDCKAAVRWLKAHAKEYGLNPDRIAAFGASAGGNLAALLGTAATRKEFEVGDNLEFSSAVQAVCDFYAPTDFLQMDAHRLPDGQIHDSADSPESELVGGPIQENRAAAAKTNPAGYVTGPCPPFFIAHGTVDRLVPFNQSEILVQALKRTNSPVEFYPVQGAGHGQYLGINGGRGLFSDARIQPALLAFLKTYLKSNP
jgi:acetyl esterase/lipase